ncbi:MAG: amino acid dehydrogenase, partial [Desulfuromonadaceae bacterium]|nr:amino acid dehydrogenase [Desulfuromonadaceae bacterium]
MDLFAEENIYDTVQQTLHAAGNRAEENLDWLQNRMGPYFAITMQEERDAIASLAGGLQGLADNQRLLLADRGKTLILARLNKPGSLYDTLKTLKERDISYAEFTHSHGVVPGLDQELEVQRFNFDRKDHREITTAAEVSIPEALREGIAEALKAHYPLFDITETDRFLRLLWLNNEEYVRISPPKRVAQILWLYQQGNRQGGMYLDVEEVHGQTDQQETRIMFAVGNPPQNDFLVQIMEVFNRLGIGVKRAYC